MSCDNLDYIKHWADIAFTVHPDFRSHTGSITTLGKDSIASMSRKQKLNTRSTAEAELVGANDAITQVLWTKLFMEAQGYQINKNILYQDNKSTILLEENGKKSSGKRTRHLNIRRFFLTDQVEKNKVNIEYCPTENMIAEYMSKPLQEKKLKEFRKQILNME